MLIGRSAPPKYLGREYIYQVPGELIIHYDSAVCALQSVAGIHHRNCPIRQSRTMGPRV